MNLGSREENSVVVMLAMEMEGCVSAGCLAGAVVGFLTEMIIVAKIANAGSGLVEWGTTVKAKGRFGNRTARLFHGLATSLSFVTAFLCSTTSYDM